MSTVLRRDPPLALIRRLATVPADHQFTTAITAGELLYGAAKRGSPGLTERVRRLISSAVAVLPFDLAAAEIYGSLRSELEAGGKTLDEPDLRIASIVLANGLTLVTGNVRHFGRVPGLSVENWLGSSHLPPADEGQLGRRPRVRPSRMSHTLPGTADQRAQAAQLSPRPGRTGRAPRSEPRQA